MLKRRVFCGMIGVSLLPVASLHAANDLLAYDLEDLSQLVVEENTATLTPSSRRETPASVIVITADQIEKSGARSLDELLAIFVPSFATMYKVHGTQMGIRGIISDRNNKILLLVNGRNMNVKATDGGAITERWISTLSDIRKVTVINGPGSAVFGPGAIAGVISIETYGGLDFEGTDTTLRAGAGESFLSAEIRHGERLGNGWGLFLHYGVEQASGAGDGRAPHKLAFDLTIPRPAYGTVTTIEANRNFPFETTPDGATFDSKPRHTFHLQLDREDFTFWSRYTRSGEAMPTLQNLYNFPYYDYGQDYPEIFQNTGNTQKQWTTSATYRQKIASGFSVEYTASYMRSELNTRTLNTQNRGKKWKEKDYVFDAVGHYAPSERDTFALGLSYDYTEFFNERNLLAGSGTEGQNDTVRPRHRWHSDLYSLYGEYQGKWTDELTLFAGLRVDRHRFSPWMISPRLALIFMPGLSDTWKLLYNRSVRHSDDADLYSIYLQTGKKGDVETIDHYEAIYMRQFTSESSFELSFYYNRHQVVAFTQNTFLQKSIGTLRFYGIEALYRYDTEDLSLFLSHSFTKEIGFDLSDPSIGYQNISASPYGYGKDLANWNNHISKFGVEWNRDRRLTLTGSVQIYWGMPGAKDMADYNMQELGGSLLLPLYSDGTRVFGESVFLNLGARYRLNEKTELSVYAYDLAGLWNEDLNKKNFFQKSSHYRDTAPSLSLTLHYQF